MNWLPNCCVLNDLFFILDFGVVSPERHAILSIAVTRALYLLVSKTWSGLSIAKLASSKSAVVFGI